MIRTRSLSTTWLDRDVAFRHSPHLAQWPLHARLRGLVEETISDVAASGLELSALELTGSHGGFNEILFAAGCEVTTVEMSSSTYAVTKGQQSTNPRLRRLLDPALTLDGAAGPYSLAVCVSVLHHVPDYLALLRRVAVRLRPGGALITCQDPLFYPRVPRVVRAVDRGAYLAWRLGQRNFRNGLAAMRRRMRHELPGEPPGEVSYYHVVRDGVDEEAVAGLLDRLFDDVEVVRYWSNHLGAARRAAEMLRLRNTFAVLATRRC